MGTKVRIIREADYGPRISLAIEYLEKSLVKTGYKITWESSAQTLLTDRSFDGPTIYLGCRESDKRIKELEQQGLLLYHTQPPKGEGYYLSMIDGMGLVVVTGGSETGVLYGALELGKWIEQRGAIPRELNYGDAPVYQLRGPAIGLQLTHVEPPRLTYEYPITPERFPWFYDKSMWIQFLDQMLENRCNVIYLWTGQPFSSLVKLKEYPEALEVTEEEYQLNRKMFTWLTGECDRRGIWLVLKFYSIHIPLPLAQNHGVELLQSKITPLNSQYTFLSIVEFIKSFPHIGLMVCLGEALRGNQNKTDWFLKTIIPAVKEGVLQAGLKEEPPLILRGHDCDPNAIMEEAVHMYGNLYTMWKYNGESLTSYLPTGKWQDTHVRLSSHGQTHIMNVHVLANLEPFRFAAPSFIQKCLQSGQHRLGTNGLHLYPLFFWDWPYSADKANPRLLQMERDWMWYQSWFRYAWNPDRDPQTERLFWQQVLAERFGCDGIAAGKILDALSYAGEIAPRILRRVGITEGNRQTMSLGMTMSQFTNVKRYRPNFELWNSVSTPGEQPDDDVKKELEGLSHYGETPREMSETVVWYATQALQLMEESVGTASKNPRELEYYLTDIQALYYMALSYDKKLEAAYWILRYKYTMAEDLRGDLSLLEHAVEPWEESMTWYRRLAELTDKTYLYANSMQTPQRKIPFPNGETYGHWTQCLPKYEEELANFKAHFAQLQQGNFPGNQEEELDVEVLPQAKFQLISQDCELYSVEKGQQVFTDMPSQIVTLAPELQGMKGIRFGLGTAITEGITVKLELEEDAQILIAYMNAKGVEWLQVPDLETNTHADDRGGLAVVFANALQAEGCPDMNIHVFQYEKGVHEIYMGTGGYAILGVVAAGVKIHGRNAGLSGETLDKLDWLYE